MSATEVLMIGHASIAITHGNTVLLSDPWYFGSIFNDSWELLANSRNDLLDGVTHIWISHEHPDHLHFPTLKMLRDQFGRSCTILVQEHRSAEVVEALDVLGFAAVAELPLGKWFAIGDGIEILCLPSRRIDSMLAVRTPSATILNLNDCKLGCHYARQVAKTVGRPDLMLAQFSIASWVANRGTSPNAARRYRVANRAKAYTDIIKPRRFLMFASFVRFCHHENDYMNDWALPPAEAEAFFKKRCDCAVDLLYPGARWRSDTGMLHAADPAEDYARDWLAARSKPLRVSPPVALQDLLEAGQELNARLAERFPAPVRSLFPPVRFYVDDHQRAVCFDVARSTVSLANHGRSDCHIALNSQTLWYAFAHRWGFDTMDISGRFELINGPKTPGSIRLCDEYSAGLNLRDVRGTLKARVSLRTWWIRRGEILDRVERRILGRARI